MKKLFFAVLLLFVLSACSGNVNNTTVPSVAVTEPVVEVTSTSVSTSTPLPTATFTPTVAPTSTSTPLPTATFTPTATATPDLIAINTDINANLESLPVLDVDVITSGRLALSEREYIKQNNIAFSDKAIPAKLNISILKDRAKTLDFDYTSKDIVQYATSPEFVPYRGISANMFLIDNQKVLVMGYLWLNKDGSTTIVHVVLGDWKNQQKLDYWKKVWVGKHRLGFIVEVYNPDYSHSVPQYGNYRADFAKDKPVVNMYLTDGGVRKSLLEDTSSTGAFPSQIENLILLPSIARWS